jgi:hypothetical protein
MGKVKQLYQDNLEAMERASDNGEMILGMNEMIINALTDYPLTKNENVLQ